MLADADAPAQTPEPDGPEEPGPLASVEVPAAGSDTFPLPSPDVEVLPPLIVTGSHIPRPVDEGAVPVYSMTRDEIERTGHTSVADLLQDLVLAGPAVNRSWNEFGVGQSEISLRALGSQRTLVLVDGHRWIRGTDVRSTSAVDLNTLPITMVDRIEILKDGASAIYGSDAVAGVINIITRKEWTGTQFSGHWQAYEDGENLTQQLNVLTGTLDGKLSALLEINYLRQEGLFATGRALAAPRRIPGLEGRQGSLHTSPIHAAFLAEPDTAAALTAGHPRNCPADFCNVILESGAAVDALETTETAAFKFRPFAESDRFPWNAVRYLLTPLERYSAFAQLRYRLFESALVSAQLLYGHSGSETLDAPASMPIGSLWVQNQEVYLDRTQIWNPFDQDVGRYPGQGTPDDPGLGPGWGFVGRRMLELGPQRFARTTDLGQIRSWLDGHFDWLGEPWYYEVSARHGRIAQDGTQHGLMNKERLRRALGAASQCGPLTLHPDCVPLNLFGQTGSVSPAMAGYVAEGPLHHTFASTSSGVSGHATGTTRLPGTARALAMAVGVEYRRDALEHRVDPRLEYGRVVFENGQVGSTIGAYDTTETFGELRVPLAERAPFADLLEAMIAVRYTDYSILPGHPAWKVGLRYRPIEDLLLRGTWSEAYRAPSLGELYMGERYTTLLFVQEPCHDPAFDEHLRANCRREGATTGGTSLFPVFIRQPLKGNPNLRAETGESITVGSVFSPRFLSGLDLAVDYFDFRMRDFIETPFADFFLTTCYSHTSSERSITCDHVHRDPATGRLAQVDLVPWNLASARITGYDVGFEWLLPWNDWAGPRWRMPGALQWRVTSQYLRRYDENAGVPALHPVLLSDPPGRPSQTVRLAGASTGDHVYPKLKINGALAWFDTPWTAEWAVRFISSVVERCAPDDTVQPFSTPGCTATETNKLSHVYYHDVQVSYQPEGHDYRVGLGVWNVLNQDPPTSDLVFEKNAYAGSVYRPPDSRAPYLKVSVNY